MKNNKLFVVGLGLLLNAPLSYANWSEAVKVDSIAIGGSIGILFKTTPTINHGCSDMWTIGAEDYIQDKMYSLIMSAYLSNEKIKIKFSGCSSRGDAVAESILIVKNDLSK